MARLCELGLELGLVPSSAPHSLTASPDISVWLAGRGPPLPPPPRPRSLALPLRLGPAGWTQEPSWKIYMRKQFEGKCKGKKGIHLIDKDKDKDKDKRSRTWTRTAKKVRRNSVARSSVLTLGKWVLWQEVSLDDLCHSYLDLSLNI